MEGNETFKSHCDASPQYDDYFDPKEGSSSPLFKETEYDHLKFHSRDTAFLEANKTNHRPQKIVSATFDKEDAYVFGKRSFTHPAQGSKRGKEKKDKGDKKSKSKKNDKDEEKKKKKKDKDKDKEDGKEKKDKKDKKPKKDKKNEDNEIEYEQYEEENEIGVGGFDDAGGSQTNGTPMYEETPVGSLRPSRTGSPRVSVISAQGNDVYDEDHVTPNAYSPSKKSSRKLSAEEQFFDDRLNERSPKRQKSSTGPSPTNEQELEPKMKSSSKKSLAIKESFHSPQKKESSRALGYEEEPKKQKSKTKSKKASDKCFSPSKEEIKFPSQKERVENKGQYESVYFVRNPKTGRFELVDAAKRHEDQGITTCEYHRYMQNDPKTGEPVFVYKATPQAESAGCDPVITTEDLVCALGEEVAAELPAVVMIGKRSLSKAWDPTTLDYGESGQCGKHCGRGCNVGCINRARRVLDTCRAVKTSFLAKNEDIVKSMAAYLPYLQDYDPKNNPHFRSRSMPKLHKACNRLSPFYDDALCKNAARDEYPWCPDGNCGGGGGRGVEGSAGDKTKVYFFRNGSVVTHTPALSGKAIAS